MRVRDTHGAIRHGATVMRIAVILPRNMHFGPTGATSIDLCARDAVLHSRHGADMRIICEDAPGLYEDMPVATFSGRGLSGRSVDARMREAARAVAAHDSNLVIVHQHAPSAAQLARLMPDRRVVLYLHGMPKRLSGFRRWWRARDYRDLAGMIFVSAAARDAFAALYPPDGRPRMVVPNGIDPHFWAGDDLARGDTIVMVGRIEPQKGSLAVAQALAGVLPRHPGWQARFIGPMAGDRAFREAFARTIAPCPSITLTGALPFDGVREECLSARIAVLASHAEGFGRVAVEAFAARLALIATRAGGLGEVIGDCAYALPSPEPAPLAQAIETLITDPALREDLATRGHARFQAHYTTAAFAEAFDAAVARLQ
ncbi:MAG: glycosyltransferase family 4 protein [Salinarimonas sp.]